MSNPTATVVTPTVTAKEPATVAAVAATPPVAPDTNIKYLIIGIDNKTGSLTYVVNDNKNIVDSASKNYPPYEVIENTIDNSSEDMQYVKIKVQKSPMKPMNGPTDRTPYFELNKNWYTLLLDEFVNPIETSGMIDKTWFTDYGLEQDPFIIFKRFKFYNNDIIIQNIKYLIDLPSSESNFYQKFPDLEANKIASLPDIQKSLVSPFFAIKSVLDMRQNRKKLDEKGQPIIDRATGKPVIIEGYFINGRDRYGYPNIMGDKSHFISALQLMFDIILYCPTCIKEGARMELSTLHQHITLRNYFLHEGDVENNIMDFEQNVKGDFELGLTAFNYLNKFLDPMSIGVFESNVTIPNDMSLNLIIVEGDRIIEKARGYELIGQICKLQDIEHYVYYNHKDKMLYNDVEIREDKQGNQMLYFIDNTRSISLYRRIGSTYRDILKSKFFISQDEIEFTLKGNKTLLFVDNFITKNKLIDGQKIQKFLLQYLSDRSKRELDKNIRTLFTGDHFKFGICNYTGEMSYFTAAMQMLYDCVPFRSQIDYKFNEFGGSAAEKMFQFQLLNNEYCLARIFDNIQVSIDPQKRPQSYNPLELTIQANIDGNTTIQENVFFNYRICAEFIIKSNIVSNLEFPENAQEATKKKFPEYRYDTIIDNYYYKRIANNLLDIETANQVIKTAVNVKYPNKPDEFSDKWVFTGKLLNFFAQLSEITDEDRAQKSKELLQSEIVKKIPGFNISNISIPAIVQNKCVDVIHKLILILFRNFNVFIDFEDDQRDFSKKTEHYKDATGTSKTPNFVIKIGRLPREPLKPAGNWIEVSGLDPKHPNAEFINGIYYPHTSGYKHTQHNNVLLLNTTGTWTIQITPGGQTPVPPVTLATSTGGSFELNTPTKFNVKRTIFNNADTTIDIFTLSRKEIGATYMPDTSVDVVQQIDAPLELADNYDFEAARFEKIGTIYKSIHHDFYYKYYNHKQKILFFDSEAIYNLESPDRYTTAVGMFPFIRLYKRNDYDYKSGVGNNPGDVLIYKDVSTYLEFMDKELSGAV